MKRLNYFLVLIIIAELSYFFYQYLSIPLDGDMAAGVMHLNGVEKIFNDPFGFHTLLQNQTHPNPNKFFSHWMFSSYYRTTPFVLQSMGVNPIESIYLSTAIFKLGLQILITAVLASYITGLSRFFRSNFLIAMLLLIPLFQTNGFSQTMGIIDQSNTYNFFYALPLALLLIFFFPLFQSIIYNKKISFNWRNVFFFSSLTIILPFSGPLIPGSILIITILFFIYYLTDNYQAFIGKKKLERIPAYFIWILLPISLLSVYSIFLGSYNSLNEGHEFALLVMYQKLILGIYYIFTENIGLFLLLVAIVLNVLLIKRNSTIKEEKLFKTMRFFLLFSIFYLLLLPLGGYRPYRQFIVRFDTFMPVTLLMILSFGMTTYHLIYFLKEKRKIMYVSYISILLFSYLCINETHPGRNHCEKKALYTIANSPNDIVEIKSNCSIVSWNTISDYKESEFNAQLFHFWGITNKKTYYYQTHK